MIRLAHLGDAPVLARIESITWRATYTGQLPHATLTRLDPRRRITHWRSRLRGNGRPQARRWWVIEQDDNVVGYTSFGPAHREQDPGFSGEVYELYVLPAVHGQGLGQRLLWHARDTLRTQGFGWWVIDVVESNRLARDFYAHHGLQTTGKTRIRAAGRVPATLRYSLPRTTVRVVRYEGPLWPLDNSSLV